MKSFFCIISFVSCSVLFIYNSGQASFSLRLIPRTVVQGEAALVEIEGSSFQDFLRGRFLGKEVPFLYDANSRTWRALLGIDVDQAPGVYDVRVWKNDAPAKAFITVKPGDFGTRRLTLPPSMTRFDEKTLARIEREEARLKLLWTQSLSRKLWRGMFFRPVPGEVTGVFGQRTLVNGELRSPHSGVDLKAEKNENVICSNHGRVALADNLFFSGNSVAIDHGQGLFTMYFHLNEILVKEGALVEKGQIIGRVGSTGRATGPHLHWGIRLNGARIDPMKFISLSRRFADEDSASGGTGEDSIVQRQKP
jgi:murein DD-endopeptidase MepM/ murein hydrolase activator NlpD